MMTLQLSGEQRFERAAAILFDTGFRFFSSYCMDPRHEFVWQSRHLPPLYLYNLASSASPDALEYFDRRQRELRASADLVTLVITSCNRPSLLEHTLRTFVQCAQLHRVVKPVRLTPMQVQHVSHQQLHHRRGLWQCGWSVAWLARCAPHSTRQLSHPNHLQRRQHWATRQYRPCIQPCDHPVDIPL